VRWFIFFEKKGGISSTPFFKKKKKKKKKLDDSYRLDVVEIARVFDMLSSLFLSWSG